MMFPKFALASQAYLINKYKNIKEKLLKWNSASTSKYVFYFTILWLVPDDGRRTQPKHVLEKINTPCENCCVYLDKIEIINYLTN